ncbi:hypothetical protein H1235_12610 [Pseudoxanthomonas sp. NC8]|nr:hypothetical protein H1235_12610 [Pseudoxanthomonas sp. NC8]
MWSEAAANLPVFVHKHSDVLRKHTGTVLSLAAGGAAATLVFFAAIVVAGAMMAYARSGGRAIGRIVVRLTGPERGPRLLRLSVATVRSVAAGVVGVALIQAILLGMGFLFAGLPGAGILALVVLFLPSCSCRWWWSRCRWSPYCGGATTRCRPCSRSC